VEEEGSEAYTAVVGFTEPLVVYPDTFYEVLNPAFATVYFQVTVDNPPTDGPLQLVVTDGEDILNVLIEEGQTESQEIAWNGYSLSLTSPTVTVLGIMSANGGGYVDQQADDSDPENPIEFVPAIDFSATQPFAVSPYVGTISWGLPGFWERDFGDDRWLWTSGTYDDWEWDADAQEWTFTGDPITDWSWTGAAWSYTGEDVPTPARPMMPPQVPDDVPPGVGYTTLTVQAMMNTMPVPNPANDLELDLSNSGTTLLGTMTISAVSRRFGDWESNPANGFWARIGAGTSWRWHSSLQEWQYFGPFAPDWSWNTAEERWSFGGDGNGWTWDEETQTFGHGELPEPVEPAPTVPSGGAPAQGSASSTFPPDASMWVWTGTEWAPLVDDATAYSLNGDPPGGVYEGSTTLHFLGVI
jgi:hypothetical protein